MALGYGQKTFFGPPRDLSCASLFNQFARLSTFWSTFHLLACYLNFWIGILKFAIFQPFYKVALCQSLENGLKPMLFDNGKSDSSHTLSYCWQRKWQQKTLQLLLSWSVTLCCCCCWWCRCCCCWYNDVKTALFTDKWVLQEAK